MIAVALLVLFGGLFAAMAIAPAALDEMERADASRREAERRQPVTLPIRRVTAVAGEREASIA